MTQLSEYVPGIGPQGAKLFIIGIAPGLDEIKKHEPFVGASGNLLRQDLSDAGYSLDLCYRTNIFKYQLPNNEFKRYHEIGLNLPDAMADLTEEVNAVNPNCILGLGDPVLFALCGKSGKFNGINVWRGSILQALGHKVVHTWHPAAELHGIGEGTWKSWQKYVRKFDIKRAVEQSQFPELNLPSRLLHVAKSSSDVYRFFEKNRNEEYCAVDIESIESIPICIGFSFNHHEGFSVPLWNTIPIKREGKLKKGSKAAYDIEISLIPTDDLCYIWKLISEFFNTPIKLIGQNFKYDEDKVNRLGFYPKLFWDTMIGAKCISSETPGGLAYLTSINTLEPYYKFEGKDFIPGKDKIDNFFLYNCKDACVTREIFDVQFLELKNEIPLGMNHANWRMDLHSLYLNIDNQGFKSNEYERKILIHKYINKLIGIEVELSNLVREWGVEETINIASPIQVADLLYSKMKIPKREGTGEEVITSLIGNVLKSDKDKNKVKVCELILDWRRVNKTLGYLQAEADYDGRMKTNYLITGTENYRTSTNLLEPPIRPTKSGWAFQTISKHGDIGNDLRSILVSDPGYVIVNLDQSQAEARVCSLLADDEETLLLYDTTDIHGLTASKIFGGRLEDYSKKILGYETPQRFIGKTGRHAYHLGVGKHQLMIEVNTSARKYRIPISISEWRGAEIIKTLEFMTPKIKSVFHETIRQLLYDNRRLTGTFGASRYFFDATGKDLWKSGFSFIPQQTVSDKTKHIALKIKENLRDIKIIVEAHDSLTLMIREKRLDERIDEIKEYTKEPVKFENCSIPRRDLVIPWEFEIGINYNDLGKYVRTK